MRVIKLCLTDFRNYNNGTVDFAPGINVFSGDNAQGKTNLIEAVCLCGMGRSPRTPRDKEMIRAGQTQARVRIDSLSNAGKDTIEILLDKAENKRVAVNGLPITRIGELMGVVAAVFFSPDELKIIKDAPSDRRRFMDIALSRMSKAYFYCLSRYNKILSQRNKLLKSGRYDNDTLDVWDLQLSETGAKIIKSRRGFIKRLSSYAAENHSALTEGKEKLALFYEGIEGEDAETIAEAFLQELKKSRRRDCDYGFTSQGPQKDDIRVMVGDTDVRSFGSQGQQRTAALSFKLSEIEIHRAETGEYPVLLLDDVLSELDEKRQAQLFCKIRPYQTLLTCTHMDEKLKKELQDYAMFRVENGSVKRLE